MTRPGCRLLLFLLFIAVAVLYLSPSIPSLNMNYVLFRSTKPLSSSRVVIAKDYSVLPHGNNPYSLQGRTIIAGSKMMPNKSIINVGFFEGSRRKWGYRPLFQPPPSPRTCECIDEKEVKFYANVTLEKNPSETGIFDILFFPQDLNALPLKRRVMDTILMTAPRSQRRIYATFECSGKLKFLALDPPYNMKMFHWSLTYHSHSDFPLPYGRYSLFPEERRSSNLHINWAKNKSRLVAWMSTWTSEYWKRATFVKRLQEHVSVDLFGEMEGRNRCPRDSLECKQKIQQYKFYLALESACCSEYISEKFWRTLSWDIVPIVIGDFRESYERLAPPHSFIFADDFETVQDLAYYLLILDKNDDLYNQYFRWKEKGEIIVNYPDLKLRTHVTTNVPPKGFFYSCDAVCRTSEKYLDEKQHNGFNSSKNTSDFFDPEVSWWWNSCAKCGKHDWIRELN